MKNKYTNNEIDARFSALTYDQSISLDQYDKPYFSIRSEREPNLSFTQGGFKDPFEPLSNVDGFALIEINSNTPAAVIAELNFMKIMNLVAERDNKYYIYKHAAILYGSANHKGFFASGKETKSVIDLFKSYILPGRFWHNYYFSLYLPDNIKLSRRLKEEMIEIEEKFLDEH